MKEIENLKAIRQFFKNKEWKDTIAILSNMYSEQQDKPHHKKSCELIFCVDYNTLILITDIQTYARKHQVYFQLSEHQKIHNEIKRWTEIFSINQNNIFINSVKFNLVYHDKKHWSLEITFNESKKLEIIFWYYWSREEINVSFYHNQQPKPFDHGNRPDFYPSTFICMMPENTSRQTIKTEWAITDNWINEDNNGNDTTNIMQQFIKTNKIRLFNCSPGDLALLKLEFERFKSEIYVPFP